MKTPLVSIIVPVFNTEKTIELCLNSIVKQTYKDIEIIVVDNGSSDQTESIARKFVNKDNRVRLLSEPKQGVFHARNRGIANSNGNYITFVDADDYLESAAIAREVELLIQDGVDIVLFDYFLNRGNTIQKCSDYLEYGLYNTNKKIILEKMCSEEYFASVWRGIYSADLIRNKIQFRKTKYSEDLLFNIECIVNANEIRVSNLPLYHYVDNDASSLKKLQYDLQNTIDYLDQLDCLVKENNNIDLQKVYIRSLNVCCLRILNTSIKYKEFKKWFSKIKLTNMMNNQDTMVKCINNNNFVRAYSILWKRKIINKIKRIA